jgi:hypothetical protein
MVDALVSLSQLAVKIVVFVFLAVVEAEEGSEVEFAPGVDKLSGVGYVVEAEAEVVVATATAKRA